MNFTKHQPLLNQVEAIKAWFATAVPNPTDVNRCVQVGCHYEEVSEMFTSANDNHMAEDMSGAANEWKHVPDAEAAAMWVGDFDRTELLDSLADQIVTAIGVAHMFGFDIAGALAEVNRSNWSKFVDGKPQFNEHGKITKGPNYTPPDLSAFVGDGGV